MNEPALLEPAFGRQKSLTLIPTFLGALRGIWLFTWKAQFTWRRSGMILAGLLAVCPRARLFDNPFARGMGSKSSSPYGQSKSFSKHRL